ncbi:MAG: MBG domain-containing protein, partial [Isosphaeraceae bacterium]
DAGTYTVFATLRNPNYAAPDATATLIISPATPTIAWATPKGIVFGTPLGSAQLNASSSVPGTFTYAPAVGTVLHAGLNQALSVTFRPDDAANYRAAAAEVRIDVAPALLTVKADDKSKVYGAANPNFTASYNGFVPGQGPESLGGMLSFGTEATPGSHVRSGGYPIVPGGLTSTDYAIQFVPGTLQVTPAPLVITADNKSKAFGAALPALTATYSGFVNGDGPSNLAVPPRLTTTATSTSPVGSYPIVASAAASADYDIVFRDGTLSVTPNQIVLPPCASPWCLLAKARTDFVTTLYRAILGRAPEPAGLAYWVRTLARGVRPQSAALSFWRSNERRDLIHHGRAPKTTFAAALSDALRAGSYHLVTTRLHPIGPCHLFRSRHVPPR